MRIGPSVHAVASMVGMVAWLPSTTWASGPTRDGVAARFGRYLAIPDSDGDGDITDRDFRRWLGDRTTGVRVRDTDRDGDCDTRDAVLVLARELRRLIGDANGDGLVNESDAAEVLAQLGARGGPGGPRPDPNLDGVVDWSDLWIVLASMSEEPIGEGAESAAETLLVSNDPIDTDGPLDEEEPIGGSGFYTSYEPDAHNAYFSSTYPGHVLGTSHSLSPAPNDHDFGISTTWPLSSHDAIVSATRPPNHLGSVSSLWPDPANHSSGVSAYWPPNHGHGISAEWYPSDPVPPVEQHSTATSRTWSPNHRVADSRSLGVHDGAISLSTPRSPHLTALSASWAHDSQVSNLAWQPNHLGTISLSWPETHLMNSSVHWTPGHFVGPSASWPPATDPSWPMNHYFEVSKGWSQPGEPIHLFPDGHSIWTTANEIIDDGN
ncbi:MAG TPA: hypothetical protein DEB06_06815 [Phycisphaerales bacterium]|nr:hypothetical protein [Phycisphaerales bacterium]